MKQHSQSNKVYPVLKFENKDNIFFNVGRHLSYNAFVNFFVGGRGVGKTTSGFIYTFNRYNNYDEQFVYLKRYKTEIVEFINTNTIGQMFDNVFTKGIGEKNGWEICCEDSVCGYVLPLSAMSTFKSTMFSKVTTIIFDEVFMEKGKTYYLPNEVFTFLQFISTVQRLRTNLRVLLFSNNNSLYNPYFDYWKIPDYEWRYFNKERGIYCENIPVNPKLLELEKVTPLYKLTAGTAYGDYHYSNTILRQTRVEVSPKPANASYMCSILLNNDSLVIYNTNQGLWIVAVTDRKIDDYTYRLYKDGKLMKFYAMRYKQRLQGTLEYLFGTDGIKYGNAKAYDMLQFIFGMIP